MYIQRYFYIENKENKSGKKKFYLIPDINSDIKRLFIDNLRGPYISLKGLLTKNIKDIMFSTDTYMNLEKEFKNTLLNFVYREINEKAKNINLSNLFYVNYSENLNEEYYSDEIVKCVGNDFEFKNDLIEKAKQLIDIDNEAQQDAKSLIDKIFKDNHINKNTIDIVSCFLDYIKENIFKKYLMYIFKVLDRNNKLDKNIIKELKPKFLKEIDDAKYEPIFLFIHNKEDTLLNLVLDQISEDKLYSDIIIKISQDLILEDYITFFF